MKRSFSLLISLVFFVVLFSGCDKLDFLNYGKTQGVKKSGARGSKGTVIGKVGNIPLTLEDMNQDISSYNEIVSVDQPDKKIVTRDQKIDYVRNEMVRRALLYQEALNRGLDKDEEVASVLEKTKMELTVLKLMKDETDNIDVTPKEVEEAYNANKEQFKEPEERNIREIVVGSEQDAKDILIQLLQGANFATLAKERSKSSSSKNGGDLGFISKGKKFSQFDAVAFSDTLDVGKTSSIFKGPDGYYIIKLEAKKGGKQASLSELYEDIKRRLVFLNKQQKLEDLINRLSKTNKIVINEGEIR
jgi:peptidyl-prolyl cis-trans isomerase C